MVIFTLHYILFTVTKVANLHMILIDLYRTIWTNCSENDLGQEDKVYRNENVSLYDQNSKKVSQEAEYIFTHVAMLQVSLAIFTISNLKSLSTTFDKHQCRSHLLNSISLSMLLQISYVYIINTLELGQRSSLDSLHTVVCILIQIALGVSLSFTNSLGDSLTVNHCINKSSNKTVGVHYHFITHLMIGAFSLALTSFIQLEMFSTITNCCQSHLAYTNSVSLLNIFSLLIELIALGALTESNDNEKINRINANESSRIFSFFGPRVKLRLDELTVAKAVYSLTNSSNNLSRNILTISGKQMSLEEMKLGKTMCSTDEEEFHNTTRSDYCPRLPIKHLNVYDHRDPIEEISYDRTKFSLYDDYSFKANPGNVTGTDRYDYLRSSIRRKSRRHPSLIEILIMRDWTFMGHSILLILIGSIYQANQFCYMVDYLRYLVHESPSHVRTGLARMSYSFNRIDSKFESAGDSSIANIVWMELICLSFIAQSFARVVGLHFVNRLLLRLGPTYSLLVCLVISSTIPIHFIMNYKLTQRNPFEQYHDIVQIFILVQLLLVQLSIGIIGSIVEFIINDLAILYSQQVANFRSSRFAQTSSQPDAWSIHGLLNGVFNQLGTSLMASSIIIIHLFTNSSNNNYGQSYGLTFASSFIALLTFASITLIGIRLLLLRRSTQNIID